MMLNVMKKFRKSNCSMGICYFQKTLFISPRSSGTCLLSKCPTRYCYWAAKYLHVHLYVPRDAVLLKVPASTFDQVKYEDLAPMHLAVIATCADIPDGLLTGFQVSNLMNQSRFSANVLSEVELASFSKKPPFSTSLEWILV